MEVYLFKQVKKVGSGLHVYCLVSNVCSDRRFTFDLKKDEVGDGYHAGLILLCNQAKFEFLLDNARQVGDIESVGARDSKAFRREEEVVFDGMARQGQQRDDE